MAHLNETVEESFIKDRLQWYRQCRRNQQALVWYSQGSQGTINPLGLKELARGRMGISM